MAKTNPPTPTEPLDASSFPLGPALDFLQRLWRLNHALEQLSGNMDKRIGVTAQQRLIVRCIGKFPAVTAGQLASVLHVDPGTISAALRRLEHKGLIERQRDPEDGRRITLRLTAAGRKIDQPADGTLEVAVERMLASTPPTTVALVQDTLEHLAALMHAQLRD